MADMADEAESEASKVNINIIVYTVTDQSDADITKLHQPV